MLNSTTWLYGAEVLPLALRSKVMGLAAASHFIVNVASMSYTHDTKTLLTCMRLLTFFPPKSHRGRTQCFRQHPRKLLLRLCSMLCILLGHRLLLLPVSGSSIL